MTLKCIAISDSHCKHDDICLPSNIDILIHAGDFCSWGVESEAVSFLEWFTKQDARYKIFIAGNHDKCFQKYLKNDVLDTIKGFSNIHYLEDSSIEIEGFKFYGSPWTPEFGYGWAFNAKRGQELFNIWEKIPPDTDVLITHGPPRGQLDLIMPNMVRPYENPNVGCSDLMNRVDIVRPKYHIFGHIHCGYGFFHGKDTTFLNSAVCDESYNPTNWPHEFSL